MWGLALGIPCGVALFWLLRRFSKGVSDGKIRTGSMLAFVFVPIPVLLGAALLDPDAILWTGIGMTVALCVPSVVYFVRNAVSRSHKEDSSK